MSAIHGAGLHENGSWVVEKQKIRLGSRILKVQKTSYVKL